MSLPGIGTFTISSSSARGDFAARLIHPPVQTIAWTADVAEHPAHFYPWLSSLMQIPSGEVINRFHEFCQQLRDQLHAGARVEWNGVGVLSKGAGKSVRFVPAELIPVESPVTAEKIIREKAEHGVRVGEDHRTAEEMRAFLNPEKVKPSRWWIAALVLLFVAIAFTAWHVSETGLNIAATSCTKSVVPLEPDTTYAVAP